MATCSSVRVMSSTASESRLAGPSRPDALIRDQRCLCPRPPLLLVALTRRALLPQPDGFEGLVWLVEPLEAHCLPVTDGPDGAVPALDPNAACAPVSPHSRYHDNAVAGIDKPLDVHPEISDRVVELLNDGGKDLNARSGPRFKGIAWVDPLDIGVQQVQLRWGGSGRPTRVDTAHDLHVLLRNIGLQVAR